MWHMAVWKKRVCANCPGWLKFNSGLVQRTVVARGVALEKTQRDFFSSAHSCRARRRSGKDAAQFFSSAHSCHARHRSGKDAAPFFSSAHICLTASLWKNAARFVIRSQSYDRGLQPQRCKYSNHYKDPTYIHT
jgi:hypothetical protein